MIDLNLCRLFFPALCVVLSRIPNHLCICVDLVSDHGFSALLATGAESSCQQMQFSSPSLINFSNALKLTILSV